MAKSQQLQIRVTPAQKTALRRSAHRAGVDISSYVLSRALPQARAQFLDILSGLRRQEDERFLLAEFSDVLSRLTAAQFNEVTTDVTLDGLSPFLQNYVTAMVEHTANRHGLAAPAWTRHIAPLDTPYFAAPLIRLRPYLLRAAPPAFKRRNLFVDATVGDRV